MELWELIARESIRDCIARWNAFGDAGRVTEMVSVLAADVEFEATGSGVIRGRDAVAAYLGHVRPRDEGDGAGEPEAPGPVGRYLPPGVRPSIRHHTSTIRIEFESEERARVRTYYAVLTSFGLDHWGRYFDEFSLVDGDWAITRRTITLEGRDPEGWAAGFE